MTSATNCPYWWLWLLASWFKVVPSNMQTQMIENLAKWLQSILLFFHFVRVRPRRLPPPHKGCCLSHIIKYFPFTYFDSLLSPGFKRNNRSGFIKLEDVHKNNHMFKTRIEFEDKPFYPSFETQVLSEADTWFRICLSKWTFIVKRKHCAASLFRIWPTQVFVFGPAGKQRSLVVSWGNNCHLAARCNFDRQKAWMPSSWMNSLRDITNVES